MTDEPPVVPSTEDEIPAPDHAPAPSRIGSWFPGLNKSQQELLDCIADYILAYGEKGSGKSIGCLHALVRHCYEENDALALIIAPQIRTGKEGVIYDLQWVLDIWKNGNWDPEDPDRVRRLDDGVDGFEYSEPALDPQTKDRVLFIGNRHGGWSKVLLMSIPYGDVVEKRMKSLSPSFVYVDEITELDSKQYFTFVSQQLGRRRGIKGPQQYYASCNPEGPSHWVYEVWWIDHVDHDSGKLDSHYAVFHVKIQENKANLPPGYVERLNELYKDDVDRRRLLKGEWIDRPSGNAIFKNYYIPEIHVRPTPKSPEQRAGYGLVPAAGFPMIVGYDPGPANFCVSFDQMIPVRGAQPIWITFDELNFVGEYMPDFAVVPRILKRMDHWQSFLGSQATFVHISDEAAFTHMRPDGSYDALRIQELSDQRIRMRGCPKGKESVTSRVHMAIGLLLEERAYVSATCQKTQDMLRLLASDKVKEGKYDANAGLKPRRSPYLHPFDAWTYPKFYFQLNPAAFSIRTAAPATMGAFRVGGV